MWVYIGFIQWMWMNRQITYFGKNEEIQYNTFMKRLNAQELRMTPVSIEEYKKRKKNPITLILDNVLDTYNVGAIFRLADALSVEKVYLCGGTETPPNSKIKKASINTWQWMEWEYQPTAFQAVGNLKSQNPNLKIVVVEQDPRSIPFQKAEYQFPLALVVGNETYGVSKEVLDVADMIVELPMWGINKSLNVMVSCGIVLYEVMKYVLREKNAYA